MSLHDFVHEKVPVGQGRTLTNQTDELRELFPMPRMRHALSVASGFEISKPSIICRTVKRCELRQSLFAMDILVQPFGQIMELIRLTSGSTRFVVIARAGPERQRGFPTRKRKTVILRKGVDEGKPCSRMPTSLHDFVHANVSPTPILRAFAINPVPIKQSNQIRGI